MLFTGYIIVTSHNDVMSIDIEISGHRCCPGETFQTLSQVLVASGNVKKYGVSALAVNES